MFELRDFTPLLNSLSVCIYVCIHSYLGPYIYIDIFFINNFFLPQIPSFGFDNLVTKFFFEYCLIFYLNMMKSLH